MRFLIWLCVAFCPMVLAAAETATLKLPSVGQKLESFSAPDYRGRTWTEKDFADAPILVVAFLGAECPLAKLYGPRLQQVADSYAAKGVRVIAVDANRQDSLAEMAAYARDCQLQLPFVKDLNNVLADRLGAERTPEVFVLDGERAVRYRGRIDDQHAIGGKSRPSPTQSEMRAAIDDLLAGRSVEVPVTQAVGCLIGRVRTPSASATVTYCKDVAPLLQDRCVECHRPGEIGPFSLTDYSEVSGWAPMIAEVTSQRRMPPWHADPHVGKFANENRLSDEQIQLIRNWVDAGAPEGNPADLPPPRSFTTGWQLNREPDKVVAMSTKPFHVPAEGEVRYQYFLVDPELKDDVWMTAAEIVPGNRAVVHHVLVFAANAGKIVDDDRQMVCAYVPGLRVTPLPQGMAKHISAGMKFVFQVHYTPNGTPQDDLTKIGLYFADPKDVTHSVQTVSARSRFFRIEPEKDNQQFTTPPLTAPTDLLLLSMSPHMHLRGKSFRYEATWPNGEKETLLDVPNYDFNWQTMYRLAEPRAIPKGTKLQAFASYDNSSNNLANPNPKATVTWGDQSWEEMLIGYADVAFPRDSLDSGNLARELRRRSVPDLATRLFKLLDRNGDGQLEKTELDDRWRGRFDAVDANQDGFLTKEELERGVDAWQKLLGQ